MRANVSNFGLIYRNYCKNTRYYHLRMICTINVHKHSFYPPSFSWGDGTFQYFAKLEGLKILNIARGLAKLGGSKIDGGDEPLFMQNKILRC